MKKRFREHKHKAKHGSSYKIHNAIRKHGDKLIYELVLVGADEYCMLIENKLRPEANIGWNINVGGEKPPMTGRKHSESMKAGAKKRALEMPKEQRDNANRNLKIPVKGVLPWNHTASNKDIWKLAAIVYEYLEENPTHGYTKLGKFLKLNNVFSVYVLWNKIKTDKWNPTEDAEWLKWVSKF